MGPQVKAAIRLFPFALLQLCRRLTHFEARLALEKDIILPVLDEHSSAVPVHLLPDLGAGVRRHHREIGDERVQFLLRLLLLGIQILFLFAKRREFVVDFTKYLDKSPTKPGDVIYLVNTLEMPTGRKPNFPFDTGFVPTG